MSWRVRSISLFIIVTSSIAAGATGSDSCDERLGPTLSPAAILSKLALQWAFTDDALELYMSVLRTNRYLASLAPAVTIEHSDIASERADIAAGLIAAEWRGLRKLSSDTIARTLAALPSIPCSPLVRERLAIVLNNAHLSLDDYRGLPLNQLRLTASWTIAPCR